MPHTVAVRACACCSVLQLSRCVPRMAEPNSPALGSRLALALALAHAHAHAHRRAVAAGYASRALSTPRATVLCGCAAGGRAVARALAVGAGRCATKPAADARYSSSCASADSRAIGAAARYEPFEGLPRGLDLLVGYPYEGIVAVLNKARPAAWATPTRPPVWRELTRRACSCCKSRCRRSQRRAHLPRARCGALRIKARAAHAARGLRRSRACSLGRASSMPCAFAPPRRDRAPLPLASPIALPALI